MDHLRPDPATSTSLGLIHEASTEHTWLPAAMIALLRANSSAGALPSHIVQQIHGYLHVPVAQCSLADRHPTRFHVTVTACDSMILIRINAWHPPGILLDVFDGKLTEDATSRLSIVAIDTGDTCRIGSSRRLYNGPISQLRATSEPLAATANEIINAAKWIAECHNKGELARILADLADLRELPLVFHNVNRILAVRVSDGCLIVDGPELCSRCRGTA